MDDQQRVTTVSMNSRLLSRAWTRDVDGPLGRLEHSAERSPDVVGAGATFPPCFVRRASRARTADADGLIGLGLQFDGEGRDRLRLGQRSAALPKARIDRARNPLRRRDRHVPGVDDVDLDSRDRPSAGRPPRAPADARRDRSACSRLRSRQETRCHGHSSVGAGVRPLTTSASMIERRKATRFQLSPRSTPPLAHQSRS